MRLQVSPIIDDLHDVASFSLRTAALNRPEVDIGAKFSMFFSLMTIGLAIRPVEASDTSSTATFPVLKPDRLITSASRPRTPVPLKFR